MQLTIRITAAPTAGVITANLSLEDGTSQAVILPVEKACLGGEALFQALFTEDGGRVLWEKASGDLGNIRIAIIEDEVYIPWETMQAPGRHIPLAASVHALVRTLTGSALPAEPAAEPGKKLRILYVIPRLRGEVGDRLQPVAVRIINGLCLKCREYFDAEVLQPPTQSRLLERLDQANVDGKPFEIVHYDGAITPAGEIVFEGEERPESLPAVELGRMLGARGVSVLSLSPGLIIPGKGSQFGTSWQATAREVHHGGVPGVVVIPRLVSEYRLATFLSNIYAGLAQGGSLGELAASERRLWYGRAVRDDEAAGQAEWLAPVIYESAPLQLRHRIGQDAGMLLRTAILGRSSEVIPAELDAHLAQRLNQPGDFDRAGVVLLLSRAFDFRRSVLLWGPAGSEKSTAAAELARWQANNGMLAGQPVLYTSFERCTSFTDVLESFGQTYAEALGERRIDWVGLEDFQRLRLVQDVMKKVPLLWVWDDFEQTTGVGAGLWDADERQKACDFLFASQDGTGKVLVLSQDDERALLGDDFLRLTMPTGLKPVLDDATRRLVRHTPAEAAVVLAASLFSGVLNREALMGMGQPGASWALAGLEELVGDVLEDLAKAGWLKKLAGRYWQPLPDLWALRPLAWQNFGVRKLGWAFVEGMGSVARSLLVEHRASGEAVNGLLIGESTNLARAVILAHQNSWKNGLADLLEALSLGFQATKQHSSEKRLLDLVANDFIDPDKQRPRPGMKTEVLRFAALCESNAGRRGRLLEAARWMDWRVDNDRAQMKRNASTTAFGRLARGLLAQGAIYRQAGHPKAVDLFIEGYQRAGNRSLRDWQAEFAYQAAAAYLSLGKPDAAMGEEWANTCLELVSEQDLGMRTSAEILLGQAAGVRFSQAQKEARLEAEQVALLNRAIMHYQTALDMVPDEALDIQGRIYEGLGFLYIQTSTGLDAALDYYREAAKVKEQAGDRPGAATAWFNAAVALGLLGEFTKCTEFAYHALAGYEALRDEVMVQRVRGLLARIQAVPVPSPAGKEHK